MSDQPDPGFVKSRARFKVGTATASVELTLPARPVRPSRLVPALRVLTNAVVDAAERDASSRGERIACSKGCGACCAQMVPLRRMEARRLALLVDRMPAPRKTEILARFAAARERLANAGVLDAVRNPRTAHDWETFAVVYFRLGIPCPFLEEGSCSIYADRPLVCREFLVTSDPEHCKHPDQRQVARLPVDSVGGAVRNLERDAQPGEDPWVLLIHALDWVADHPEETAEPVDASEFLNRVLEQMQDRPEKGR